MASTKALTGGTGDVNPQQLFARVVQTGADVNTTVEVPLPVPRSFTSKKGSAIVVEILRSEVRFSDFTPAAAQQSVEVFVGTAATPDPGEATTFLVEGIDGLFASAVGFALFNR